MTNQPNIDTYVETLASLIENRENYQRLLGQVAIEIQKSHGNKGLNILSEELKDRHGKTIAPSTLRNYGWVEQETGDLDLPEDVSYRTRRAIAGTDNPEKWAKMIEEGYTNAEVYNAIREYKGLTTDDKKTKCPNCGHVYG